MGKIREQVEDRPTLMKYTYYKSKHTISFLKLGRDSKSSNYNFKAVQTHLNVFKNYCLCIVRWGYAVVQVGGILEILF